MSETIVTPDVEQALCNWLTLKTGYPSGTRVPDPRPAAFYRVSLAGGAGRRSVVISQPTLTVEAYADLESTASQMIRAAQGLLISLSGQSVDGVTFYRIVEFAEPANLSDPRTDQARYTSTVSIGVRATAI